MTMTILLATLRVLVLAVIGTSPLVSESGRAAVYGQAGDRLAGGPLACTGQRLRPHDLVCAHRTLPCRTPMIIVSQRSQRVATCQVLDRGPYGARLPSGRFVLKTRSDQRGTWRAQVDLSPGVARMLGVSDTEPVTLIYALPPGARPPEPENTPERQRQREEEPKRADARRSFSDLDSFGDLLALGHRL